MRRIAPLAVPRRSESDAAAWARAAGGAPAGGTTAKLSVTVTSAAGRPRERGRLRATRRLVALAVDHGGVEAAVPPTGSDFTSRNGESCSTKTLPVGSMR